MNFLIDENVSLALAQVLRSQGHTVMAIAEIAQRGMSDEEIWLLAGQTSSVLITRDYHFTNPTRFNPQEVGAIMFVRPGNLSSIVETQLVCNFLDRHSPDVYASKLVTLSMHSTKIR